MGFAERKKEAQNNLLAAEKVGDLDQELKSLLTAINALSEYYTTSSCMGRVGLMRDLGNKSLDTYIGKWHRKVAFEEVNLALAGAEGKVWLRYEPPILHVMARTAEAADAFLHLCRESGFKRSGIQTLKDERMLIEVLSTERVDAPVSSDGRVLASEEYLRFLIGEANMKFDAGAGKLARLEKKIAQVRSGSRR
jgi:tRNA wybutosine-synthesizing protein 3